MLEGIKGSLVGNINLVVTSLNSKILIPNFIDHQEN